MARWPTRLFALITSCKQPLSTKLTYCHCKLKMNGNRIPRVAKATSTKTKARWDILILFLLPVVFGLTAAASPLKKSRVGLRQSCASLCRLPEGHGSMTFNWSDWVRSKGQLPAEDDNINVPCCIKLSLFFRHLLWMSFISGLQPLWKWGCLFEKLVSLHWWLIASFCSVYLRWRWECASNVALWPKAVNGGSGAWRRALRTSWPSDW